MSKRLAITISGAVSLGSYEAGVLYEYVKPFANTMRTRRLSRTPLTGSRSMFSPGPPPEE
jgi:hypothetical protein